MICQSTRFKLIREEHEVNAREGIQVVHNTVATVFSAPTKRRDGVSDDDLSEQAIRVGARWALYRGQMPYESSSPNKTARESSAQRGAVSANHDVVEHGFDVPFRVCTHPTPGYQPWPEQAPNWECVLVAERQMVRAAGTTSEILATADQIGAQQAREPYHECIAVRGSEVSRGYRIEKKLEDPLESRLHPAAEREKVETCATELQSARVIACTSGSHTECGQHSLSVTARGAEDVDRFFIFPGIKMLSILTVC